MPKKVAVPVLPMRVLKIHRCPSLSGRSTLTYRIACHPEGDIHFSIVANSASGQFNADPIPLDTIEKLLMAHPPEKPMSSRLLHSVFKSKSSNSPAFLFAALLAEDLVKAGAEKDSGYRLGDIEAFKQAMAALIASGIDLDGAQLDSIPLDTPNPDTAVTVIPEVSKRKRKEA